ncbi:MAG: hypothetical protein PSX36_10265 [bacterium]|nr:hypothetical protein [bacterium]
MAKNIKKKKATKKSGPKKGVAYLTKRALTRAITKGTKNEESDAIDLLGYTVKEDNGWVIRQYASGQKERISRINVSKSSSTLVLD